MMTIVLINKVMFDDGNGSGIEGNDTEASDKDTGYTDDLMLLLESALHVDQTSAKIFEHITTWSYQWHIRTHDAGAPP